MSYFDTRQQKPWVWGLLSHTRIITVPFLINLSMVIIKYRVPQWSGFNHYMLCGFGFVFAVRYCCNREFSNWSSFHFYTRIYVWHRPLCLCINDPFVYYISDSPTYQPFNQPWESLNFNNYKIFIVNLILWILKLFKIFCFHNLNDFWC